MSNEAINTYQTFRDDDGVPLANGTVSFLVNLDTPLATIFSDEALTVPQANPYPLDAFGRIIGDVKFTGLRTLLIKTNLGATVRTINNVSSMPKHSNFVKSFDTLLGGTVDTSVIKNKGLVVGDNVEWDERTAGNGGKGSGKVVLTSGVVPNTDDIVISTGDALLSIVVDLGGIVHTDQFGLIPDWDGSTGTDNTARYQRLLVRAQDGEFNHIRFPGPETRDYYFQAAATKTTCCFLKQDVNDWQANPRPIIIDGDATISIDNSSANVVWMSGPDDADGTTSVDVVNNVDIEGNLTITSAVGTAGFDDPKLTMTNFGIAFNISRWWRSKFKFNAYYIKGLVQAPSADGLYDSNNTFIQQVDIVGCNSTHHQENFIEATQGFSVNILWNKIERGNGAIKLQRSNGQSFFKTTVGFNTIQGNAKTNPFLCNFGVSFAFVWNYLESNRGTAGEAIEQVRMAPNAVTDLNSLVFENNFFSQSVAALDLFGGPYNHVELDGFTNFFPKGNNFTGGNGYNMTSSTGLVMSEGETYTPVGSAFSEGAVTIPSSTIDGFVVTGKVYNDTDDVNRVDASKVVSGADGFMTMESAVIADNASFTFRKITRGMFMLANNFTNNTQSLFVAGDAGVAPEAFAQAAGTLIDFSATPSTPAAGRIDVAVNATSDGITVFNNLGSSRKFVLWTLGTTDWA